MLRLAVLLVMLLMPLTAWAGEDLRPVLFDPAKPHAQAYAPAEEPEWMPKLLTKLHHWIGPSYKLKQHVLFRWKGEPAWLAMVTRSDDYGDKLTLFRITAPGEAKAVMTIKEDTVKIIEPSGIDGFGDGTPQLAVYYGCGDSASVCYGVLSLHLDDKIRDATPPGYFLRSFTRDGRYLIAWEYVAGPLWFECTNCATTILLALRWNGQSYEEVCDQTPWLYQEEDRPDHGEGLTEVRDYLHNRLSLASDLLQSHHSDEATAIYRDMLKHLSQKQDADADKIRAVRQAYDRTFQWPRIRGACPLPIGSEAPPGLRLAKDSRNYLDMMSPIPSPYHP